MNLYPWAREKARGKATMIQIKRPYKAHVSTTHANNKDKNKNNKASFKTFERCLRSKKVLKLNSVLFNIDHH